jgi:hypothetical protein
MTKTFAFLLAMATTIQICGQQEKFDIATFIPPSGWQRLDSNGVLAFHDERTTNGQTSFGQIVLFPSWASNNTAEKNFTKEWDDRVAKTTGDKTKPTTQTEKTPDGWTVVTGTANLSARGMTYGCILVTASGFGKAMSVMVNTAGSDHALAIETFFNDLNLDSKATAATNQQNNALNMNQTIISGTISMNNYDFIPPQGWQVQNKKDYLQVQNMGSSCLIQVFTPQPSSGNLEQDTKAVFEMMYKGWQFQRTGEQQYILSTGFLPKGLEYCMMEAPMSMTGTDGRYNLEEGAALLVKANNQNVIISVRHNSSMLGHDDCWKKYETWRRFFNSFTVKNAAIPKSTLEENAKKIVGVWKITGHGVVAGEYVFAANGNYQFGGGIGSSTTTTDYNYEYLHLTSYSFQGDGSYSIAGDQLTLRKRGTNPEQVLIRFEQVNHGGMGWKDRFHILKRSADDGKEYEACYEQLKSK